MNTPWIFRQGDVLVMQVAAIPTDALAFPRKTDNGRTVLAYGEVTGHAHALDAKMATAYGPSDDAFWMAVEPGATITHEEHSAVVIPDTVQYVKVVRQREYSAAGERRVAD
jgi:hypothetical protein